ncbi:cache domain-containing protein, partial [Arcobacteraceae bacterium]|nr:cache domain-containing protein [Arcobacteraceae bacterium]
KIHKNIVNEKKLTREKLKVNVKEKVNMAHTVATTIYEKYKASKSKQEIKELIQNALVNIRFNNERGYFFIYSLNYECILLPVDRKLEGQNFYNFKDSKGIYITREIIKQMRKDKEGFLTWWYHKPSDKSKQYEKIGYNKYFEPLDWFIGTGEYVEDFEEIIKSSITERISTYRYDKDGYVFILDKNATTLTHLDKKERGQNRLDIKDKNGISVVKKLMDAAYNKENNFVEYTFKKYSSKEEKNKISYVVHFKDWDWVIGTGFYTDDMKKLIQDKEIELIKEQKEQFNTIIIIFIMFMTIIIVSSLLLSYAIQNRFENYKNKAKEKDRMLSEQSKMASMGEMIGNIAHQWRQPLSIISTGATGMLAQKEFDLLSDEQFKSTCKAINQNAQYLSKTIDDFKTS